MNHLVAPAGDISARAVDPVARLPLVVDLDGSLLKTDLLWEGILTLVLRHPLALGGTVAALLKGKASLKEHVARRASPDLQTVPLEASVVTLIEAAHAAGRPVILASGAHEWQVALIGARLGVFETIGSDAAVNLTGRRKLERVLARCEAFDYVGNDASDLDLWARASTAYAVKPTRLARWRARRRKVELVDLPASGVGPGAWIRALRPHQWAKNALLGLPALAAHLSWSLPLAASIIAGFAAFCLASSAVYLTNDLFDLAQDRQHPTKRRRPLAAGELSVPGALALILLLGATAAGIASRLPGHFQASLSGYVLIAGIYCALMKRLAVADVLTLATLYTVRVIAGAALVEVELSRWFLAFSVFFFLSLAVVKRVVELQSRPREVTGSLPGRGYSAEDIPVLTGLGLGATVVGGLVYCLYITSADVVRQYARPDLLWGGLLIYLYWQVRVWILTGRNRMTEDPVIFALRDPTSRFAFLALLAMVVLAMR